MFTIELSQQERRIEDGWREESTINMVPRELHTSISQSPTNKTNDIQCLSNSNVNRFKIELIQF